jgi:dolichol kinase
MVNIIVKEILRKSIHLLGILIPGIYYFSDRSAFILWFGLIVGMLFIAEWMRLRGIISFPGIILRSHEGHKVASYLYMMASALIVIALFSKTIAIVAITMAIIGDTCSGIVGSLWGKGAHVRHTRLPFKPAPILLVMFLTSFFSGYLATLAPRLDALPIFSLALGALGAMIADGVPWHIRGRILDDNLTIPIISGLLIFLSLNI